MMTKFYAKMNRFQRQTTCFTLFSLISWGSMRAAGDIYQVNEPKTSIVSEEAEKEIRLYFPEEIEGDWSKYKAPTGLEIAPEKAPEITGNSMDARPPELLIKFIKDLEVLDGTRLPENGQFGAPYLYLGFPSSYTEDPKLLWSKLIEALRIEKIPIGIIDETKPFSLFTAWYTWDEGCDELVSDARYQLNIVRLKGKNKLYLKVSLLDGYKYLPLLGEKNPPKEGDLYALNAQARTRHLSSMANKLMRGIEKLDRRIKRATYIKENDSIEVETQYDEQEQPKFVIHAPFALVWEITPRLLKTMFIRVEDKNRSRAEMTIEYFPPQGNRCSPEQTAQGFTTLDLIPEVYRLQFFDRKGATEIQICTEEHEVIYESGLIFEEALSKAFKNYQYYLIEGSKLSDKASKNLASKAPDASRASEKPASKTDDPSTPLPEAVGPASAKADAISPQASKNTPAKASEASSKPTV